MKVLYQARCPMCPVMMVATAFAGLKASDVGLAMARHVGLAHPDLVEDRGERELRQLVNRIEARKN